MEQVGHRSPTEISWPQEVPFPAQVSNQEGSAASVAPLPAQAHHLAASDPLAEVEPYKNEPA